MIKDLHIQNYRLFKELNIDNLSQVNLVVGANNSGKSSLLEAIYILSNDSKLESLGDILYQRGELLSENGYAKPDIFTQVDTLPHNIFYGRSLQELPTIKIESKSIDTKLSLKIDRNAQSESQDNGSIENGALLQCIIETGETKVSHPLPLKGEHVLRYNPYQKSPLNHDETSSLITTDNLDYKQLATLWDDITLTPGEDRVISALQIVEPAVKRISFTSRRTSNSGILLQLANEDKPIPLGSMGDGMRRVLAIIASLVSVGSGNLLIDEIDTGLYHGVLTDMWRLVIQTAKQQDAQVFATTHSWDCVKAFQQALAMEEDDQVGCLIRLDRIGEQTKVVRYDANRLAIAVNQEIEVR